MTKILIVDDNAQNLYLLEALLNGAGYEVIPASNGAAALDLARQHTPDLVISDILMPIMDGYELCRRWKADDRHKNIPFIFYTATYTDPRDEKFGLSLGADRFLLKPSRIEILQQVVSEVLEEARRGVVKRPERAPENDDETLLQYNKVIFRKLQDKVKELEWEIAARRNAEGLLKKERNRAQNYLNMASVMIVLLDADESVQLINKKGCALLGYEEREVLGKNWFATFLPEKRRAELQGAFRRTARGEAQAIESYESTVLTKAGTERTILWHNTLLKTESGEFQGLLCAGEDFTERKQMEEELRQVQKMESVGRLAGGVAHDFNNVLTAITGYAGFVLRALDTSDPKRDDVKEILAAADRAAALTRQLLAFSRKQVINPEVFDLNGAVESTVKMLKRLIGEHILLETCLAAEPCLIKADSGQLGQVLLNLAVNARDAMPKGGKLTVSTQRVARAEEYYKGKPGGLRGPLAVLTVQDTGVGMTDEVRAHVFEPFFTTKEKGKGTGLGLATVYGIVKQSGAELELESAPGKGTTFRVIFQLSSGTPKSAEKTAEVPLRGSETLLLVEDEETLRKLDERILSASGYKVLAYAAPTEALKALESRGQPVDLLITDVILPGISGRDLAREAARRALSRRTLYVSGYTDDAVMQHGALEPGLAFLQKPFTAEGLLRKVREVLDGPADAGKA